MLGIFFNITSWIAFVLLWSGLQGIHFHSLLKYSCESPQRIPESTDVKLFNFEKVSWLSFNMKGRGYLDNELRSSPLSIHAMDHRCYELGFLSLLCIRCERLNQEPQFRQLGYQDDIDYEVGTGCWKPILEYSLLFDVLFGTLFYMPYIKYLILHF
jgi:hypothetical protein